jgi:hypothetical protein
LAISDKDDYLITLTFISKSRDTLHVLLNKESDNHINKNSPLQAEGQQLRSFPRSIDRESMVREVWIPAFLPAGRLPE